jgi:hypothetical protein
MKHDFDTPVMNLGQMLTARDYPHWDKSLSKNDERIVFYLFRRLVLYAEGVLQFQPRVKPWDAFIALSCNTVAVAQSGGPPFQGESQLLLLPRVPPWAEIGVRLWRKDKIGLAVPRDLASATRVVY